MAGTRARIPREVETQLLVKSRRRCCLCVFLSGDLSQKQVQIAHISGDRTDSWNENLVVLCLDHHDRYDSSTSQSKGFTSDEVRHYKARLEDLIDRWEHAPHQLAVPHALVSDLTAGTILTRFLQSPPLPSSAQSSQDTDALPLFRTLLDPSQDDQARGLLVENDLLSPDIDHVETVTIETKLSAHVGKPHCVLSIGGRAGWTWDVLFFLYRGGKWCRVGRIPLPGQRSHEPVVNYVPGENTGALSVEHVAGYGTGVFQKATTWYRVGPEGLVPLFSYPVQAYVVGWGMPFQRHVTGEVLETPHVLEAGSRLEISLAAEYSADPSWLYQHQGSGEFPLFSYAARLILEWDGDARIFLPSKESTATFEQAEGLFNDDTSAFLTRYVDQIIGLVNKGGKLEREWVKDLVAQSRPSADRSRIETMLDEATPNHGMQTDAQENARG